MSDPRTSGKSSKTAAVVMLVVFIQVLIVAVLGLGAIGRDRIEARRLAELEADRGANRAMAQVLNRSAVEVSDALRDVRNNLRFQDLEWLREQAGHGRYLDLVGIVFQVDPETREIFWMDGETRLYVPPARRAELIDQSEAFESDQLAKQTWELYATLTDIDRLMHGIKFCRDFPYRFEDGYAQALGAALRLIGLAGELTEFSEFEHQEDAWVQYERTLLTAIEVMALNRDRQEDLSVGDRPKLQEIAEAVDAAIASLPPDRLNIRRHVEACRDARLHLESPDSLLQILDVALHQMERLRQTRKEDPKKRKDADVTWISQRLVGLIPDVRMKPGAPGSRDVLVVLNVEAARNLIEEVAEADRTNVFDPLGLELTIVPNETLAEEPPAVEKDLEQMPGLRIPYRAELRWVREPQVPVGGPGEFFYWGIIGLSAAGLGMGGWVMMRLYTREVRLARLKADFVSNLSHELKTPLTSIALWTELLQDGALQSAEEQTEGIGILSQEAERLQGIVHRMLDTAKREARGMEYELKPGDLNEVVGAAAERFRRITAEPGLDLTVALHPGPLPVRLDRAAMDDTVSNLISNAWKYKRGSEVRIEVRTARRGRKAEVTVADDGLGIPRRERGKVFEMFYRAEAYLTRAAGTGLGLSLVRTIVRAHKGWVRIENGLEGQGSTFRIRIPLTRARLPSDPVTGSVTQRSEAQTTS